MQKNIILLGAGGHSKVVADLLAAQGYHIYGFIDSGKNGSEHIGYPILGGDEMLNEIINGGIEYAFICFAGFGVMKKRLQKYNEVKSIGFKLPSLIHPSATVSPSAKIGAGTCVMPGAVINAYAEIGANCIINTRAVIEHDCRLANNVHVCPGAVLGGNVEIGESAVVGLGANIIHGMTIGRNSIVGAGSVVIRNVVPEVSVAGVPARVML